MLCWLIIGLGLAVGAIVPRKKPDLILMGLVTVMLGGFARLYGFTEYGPLPHEYAPVAIEFIGGVPLLVLFYMWRREQSECPAKSKARQ